MHIHKKHVFIFLIILGAAVSGYLFLVYTIDVRDLLVRLIGVVTVFGLLLFKVYEDSLFSKIDESVSHLNKRMDVLFENKKFDDMWTNIIQQYKSNIRVYPESTEDLMELFKDGLNLLENKKEPLYSRSRYIGHIIRHLEYCMEQDDPTQIVYLALLNFTSSQKWPVNSWTSRLFQELLKTKQEARNKGMHIVSIFLLDKEPDNEIVQIINEHVFLSHTFKCLSPQQSELRDNQCALMLRLGRQLDGEILRGKKLSIQEKDLDLSRSVIFLEESIYTSRFFAATVIRNEKQIMEYFKRYRDTLLHCEDETCV